MHPTNPNIYNIFIIIYSINRSSLNASKLFLDMFHQLLVLLFESLLRFYVLAEPFKGHTEHIILLLIPL